MTAEESELERTRRVLDQANATITALEGRIDELIVERGGMLDTARSLRLRAELAELKGELNRAGLLGEHELCAGVSEGGRQPIGQVGSVLRTVPVVISGWQYESVPSEFAVGDVVDWVLY